MLKLVGKKESKREDEENKGEEVKKKTSPAEIRWRKEIPDLDLPDHASVDFPDEADIMNFNVTVDLKKEEWLWKGGKYLFSINIPKTYPHKPPKVHWDTQIYNWLNKWLYINYLIKLSCIIQILIWKELSV